MLQGESTLIMAADNEFVLGMVKKPAIEQLIREKASALLGRPVAVRFALKNQVSNLGKDPMDALVQFGEQHSDIFTIKYDKENMTWQKADIAAVCRWAAETRCR